MRTKKIISAFIALLIYNFAFSQIMYDQYVKSSYAKIKSFKMVPVIEERKGYIIHYGPEKGDSLANPVFPLIKNKGLKVDFDILEDSPRDLRYKIIHCDRNWQEDNLIESEYITINEELALDGDRAEISFSTTVPYIHYSFLFPFSDVTLHVSGNYILQIYELTDDDNIVPLIQKRFVVYEQLVEIQAEAKRPNIVQFIDFHQQIETKIIPHGFDLSNYDKDLFVVYRQNGRWDKTITGIKPSHISGDGNLIFNDNRNALFEAGNEFHQFAFKNLHIATFPIDYIHKENGTYKIKLHADDDWHSAYTSTTDLNGKFLIYDEINPNSSDYTADYAEVQFSLPYHKTMNDTFNLYVCGEFNDWKMNDENKMTYNIEKQQYEATILLKQGYYSYTYIRASDDFKTIDYSEIDGSFYQTENEYEVFVYYYDYSMGYDRCIGYKRINSKK